MNSVSILWITTFVMAGGGFAILAKGRRRTPAETMQTILHGTVPLMAACLYFAMATGQGASILPTADGGARIFYWARYVDWTFTTPLLLLSLGLSAMHNGQKRAGLLAGAAIADLIMIGTAFAFSASLEAWTRWTWFAISCAAFLAVYYVIWGPQLEANKLERADVQSSYRRNAAILSALWLVYPLILAVSPDGLDVVGDAAAVLGIAVLDVLSKVAYGLLTVAEDEKATDRDLAEAAPAARGYVPAE